MGGCTSTSLKLPNEKRFRRAIKHYEVTEVSSMTNLFNRNRCFETGESPLTLAAEKGHEAVVQSLIQNGADVNKVDRHGRRPLQIAAQLNDLETTEILLAAKANPNKYDENNITALHTACERGYRAIAHALLLAGADPRECRYALPPLVYAVENQQSTCVELLLKYNADPNVYDSRGNPLTRTAVNNGDAASTKLLLKYNASLNLPGREDDTLIVIAAMTPSPGVVKALLEYNVDFRDYKHDEPPPLIGSTAKGCVDCVDLLIRAGGDVNIKDKRGQTPLYISVMSMIDHDKHLYFCKYFSNVYRKYSHFDPMIVNYENTCKCAMSLVQGGADVTTIWEHFAQVFPDPEGINFEQMVLCEVLVQTYGFRNISVAKLRTFISALLNLREIGLVRLLVSAGVDPVSDDLTVLALRNEQTDKDAFLWLKKMMRSPRQLKDLCRKTIRHLLSWNVLFLTEQLPISTELKDYICIMDTDYYTYVEDVYL